MSYYPGTYEGSLTPTCHSFTRVLNFEEARHQASTLSELETTMHTSLLTS